MRTICLLLLALCALLPGSHAFAANAGIKSVATHSTQLKSANPQNIYFSTFGQEHAIVKNTVVGEEIEYAADVDNEDEDYTRISTKEQVLLINYFLTFTCAFLLTYLFNTINSRLPNCGHLAFSSSSKYLTQRVLRI